jgi:hypothetical protein
VVVVVVVVDAAPPTDSLTGCLIVDSGEPAGAGAAGAGDDRGTGGRARAYRDGLAHRSGGDTPGRSRPLQSLRFGWSLGRSFKSGRPILRAGGQGGTQANAKRR